MMEWGWPEWVVAGWLAIRFAFAMIKVMPDAKTDAEKIGYGVGRVIALMFLAFIVYALHVGGFW